MDILCGCARQNINQRSDVHAIEVTWKTDNRQRKENRKEKFNVTETDYRVLNEKRLFFAELPFSGLKTPQFNDEVLIQLQ